MGSRCERVTCCKVWRLDRGNMGRCLRPSILKKHHLTRQRAALLMRWFTCYFLTIFLYTKEGPNEVLDGFFSLLISKNRWTFLTHGDMIWTSPGGGSSSISPVGRILRSIKKNLRRLGWDPGFKVSWYWNPCRCAGLSFLFQIICFGWSLILATNSGPKKMDDHFFVIMDDFFMIMFFLNKPALLHFLLFQARTQRSMWMFGWLLIVPAGKVEV